MATNAQWSSAAGAVLHNADANIQAKQMSHFPRHTVAAEVCVCGSDAARRVDGNFECVLGRFFLFFPTLICCREKRLSLIYELA